MRLVFMGTPAFAVPSLTALAGAGHDIALVVTQPDRPKGRGMKLVPSPVKQEAERLGLPVFQPIKVRAPEAVSVISGARPDAIVVAAFGQILPKSVLDIPQKGCFNVHASLLPRYRGAAPINWAIINGDGVTGITIMRMDEGLDTGDMLLMEEEPILPTDTAGTLGARLSAIGARMAVAVLSMLAAGTVKGVKQDGALSTYAPMLKKDMGLIDWTRPAEYIERIVRGLDPWPGAFTVMRGGTLKVWGVAVASAHGSPGRPGEVISAGAEGIVVSAGDGAVALREIQPAGKRRMAAREFLAGHAVAAGERIGG